MQFKDGSSDGGWIPFFIAVVVLIWSAIVIGMVVVAVHLVVKYW